MYSGVAHVTNSVLPVTVCAYKLSLYCIFSIMDASNKCGYYDFSSGTLGKCIKHYKSNQKPSDNFLYLLYKASYFLLWVILLNCQRMDLIELIERSISMSERSGLAHFPIIRNIIK